MPFCFINRPTRRCPTARPSSFSSFSHTRAAITAERKTVLLTDMRQDHKVLALAFTHRARSPGPVTPRCHLEHPAQPFNRPDVLPSVNEGEPHHFWLAKNAVAFFNISRSSFRMRFSRRSCSTSFKRSADGKSDRSSVRCVAIHLPSVESPMPKSAATCLRESPLLSASRTASRWKSSPWSLTHSPVSLRIDNRLSRAGIKPGQVQLASPKPESSQLKRAAKFARA